MAYVQHVEGKSQCLGYVEEIFYKESEVVISRFLQSMLNVGRSSQSSHIFY